MPILLAAATALAMQDEPAKSVEQPPAALAPGYLWAASLSATASAVQPRDQHWRDTSFSLRRFIGKDSLAFEALDSKRFGLLDKAYALDGYLGLWQGAYANLRYQQAPQASLFPHKSWRGEVFQNLAGGWELSLSEDVLGFDGNRVEISGLGLGRYVGNFYIRLRHTKIDAAASSGSGDRLMVRWYYTGDGDNYLEFAASRGRSADPLDLLGGQQRSGASSINAVRYFTPEWGLRFGASYSSDAGGASERGLTLALTRRW